jgi:DNA repair protein RecO (recombination protein O)
VSIINTSAILLRRIEYGDSDLILTLLTTDQGKLSVIAKSAKKSVKRFSGALELFSMLDVVYEQARSRGLSILKEAVLRKPFVNIRSDIIKTGYASYWSELTNLWLEEGQAQPLLFRLLEETLDALNRDQTPGDVLSIFFQLRFLTLAGYQPNFESCSVCRAQTSSIDESRISISLAKGGVLCCHCADGSMRRLKISKGTLKQLLWMEHRSLEKARRVRFSPLALKEALDFLESFVPYHLGKTPRSLSFLQQMRKRAKTIL